MHECIPYEQIPFIRESIIKLWYDKYVEVSMGTACFGGSHSLFLCSCQNAFRSAFLMTVIDTKRAHLKA